MNLSKTQFALTLMLIALPSFAGEKVGNGGDICEDRIKIVRDDIRSWIENGGAKDLKLPQNITGPNYQTVMLDKMAKAQVSCTDQPISIHGAEKTCKNYLDDNGIPQIVCNTQKFLAETPEPGQYVLVHHEYAGLAGFEENTGKESVYPLSNQITSDLQYQLDMKLAVKSEGAANSNVAESILARDTIDLKDPAILKKLPSTIKCGENILDGLNDPKKIGLQTNSDQSTAFYEDADGDQLGLAIEFQIKDLEDLESGKASSIAAISFSGFWWSDGDHYQDVPVICTK